MKVVSKKTPGQAFVFLTIIVLSFILSGPVFGQGTLKPSVNRLIARVEAFNSNLSEKLYLHTDKPYYVAGDTLWFKCYLLNERLLEASDRSGILYVELANDSNVVVKRIMLPVFQGLSYSQIALHEDIFPEGGYTLRAYTNWMRNFGEECFFRKRFLIGRPTDKSWLLNYGLRLGKEQNTGKAYLSLKITRVDSVPVGLRELQVHIQDHRKTWFRKNLDTNVDGTVNLVFDLPEKIDPGSLTLSLQDLRKGEENRQIHTPVKINRPEKLDLQFLPEGGVLLAGAEGRVAFKALNEDGLGANVSGKVYNSRQQIVAEFRSSHLGMGTFGLVPEPGESYYAKISLPDGSFKSYPLPLNNSGTSLMIRNDFQSDSIEVLINASADISRLKQPFLFVAQSKAEVRLAASVSLNNGFVRFKIDKRVFPQGICRLTLCGPDSLVRNERLVYIHHGDNLHIQLSPDKNSYTRRDSVSLRVKVTDRDGNPVRGSFSMAVTDNSQVRTDSPGSYSIVTYLTFGSYLKGHIEDAAYYADPASDPQKWNALDKLLLTQGWSGYGWNDILKPERTFIYAAEKEFMVKGRVLNAFNKAVARSGVSLLSRRPLLFADTVTNERGEFVFTGIFPVDTASFFIQAKNRKGKSFNVGIVVDEYVPPVCSHDQSKMVPWFVNTDTVSLNATRNRVVLRNEQIKASKGLLLREVTIKAKRIIPDSKNLNGPGEADVVLDEKYLEKAGRTNLEDLLSRNVKGFGTRTSKSGERYYSIQTMAVHLIIDGIDTGFFFPGGMSFYDFLKQYFDYYDAEEIKGIEVMTSGRFQMSYTSRFLGPMEKPWDHAFIEVTTRGGKGPFLKKTVGTYLYKPIPFTTPCAFYSPKYTPESIPDGTDIRPTVYWDPNIITDKQGEATICFFTSDNPGVYSVIMEGTDLAGAIGAGRTRIVVKK
ncbi:hypothetical protein [Pararcticibacter amylolyticus]|uniref:TonB-dependent receptor n=1 Tax=Pararcticibacter amylolyticus TaxID=2173175 RepID=A0A2U2PAS4_9SPHI|nr:hypothetical protein [Pararcticibacter amylolyticus]PWG78498.1 hypothetical protein DDR33_21980 [Pararcticibacter amylolyticus]